MVTPTGKATTTVVNKTTVPFNQTMVTGGSNQSQQQTSNATTPIPAPLPTRIRILLLWFKTRMFLDVLSCNRLIIDKTFAFYFAGTPATGFEYTSHDENRSDK